MHDVLLAAALEHDKLANRAVEIPGVMRQFLMEGLQLAAVGIQATSHYEPLHDSRGAARFLDRPGHCPVTVDISGRLLRLPFYNELTDADVDRVAEELVKVLSR